jgi:hypothetical protein
MKLTASVDALHEKINARAECSLSSGELEDGAPASRHESLPIVTGPLMTSFKACTRALVVTSLHTGCCVGFQSKQTNGKWLATEISQDSWGLQEQLAGRRFASH